MPISDPEVMTRYIKYLLFLSLPILMGWACTDKFSLQDNIYPSLSPHYLSINNTQFYIYTPEASREYISVESWETPWKFTSNPSWLTLSPNSGKDYASVTLDVAENERAEERTGIFYFSSDVKDYDYNVPVSVTQAANSSYVRVEMSVLEFGGTASNEVIYVESNCSWEIDNPLSWVTVEKLDEGNQLKISVEENPSNSYRNGYIYIRYSTGSKSDYVSIYVTQFPAEITVSEMTLDFENSASKYNLTLTSEASWTALASASWIQVDPKEGGPGETSLSIEVTQNGMVNSRTGYVSIMTGDYDRLQISVNQKGLYLETEKMLSFSSRAGAEKIELKSNVNWEVVSCPEWLSVTPTSGSGSEEITVSVAQNNSSNSRTGDIIFGVPGLDITFSTTVVQSGITLTPGATFLQFTDKAGSQPLEITADGEWTSEVDADWISISPISGKGDTTVSVSVSENTTEESRKGNIIYRFDAKETVVTVLQAAKYFDIDSESFTFTSAGGAHEISLGTNQKWSAQFEGDNVGTWLSLTQYSGEGETTLKLVATQNNTIQDREAALIITPEYSRTIRIKVLQKARYLKVSATNISFFSRGGESDPIIVDTDGDYDISSSVTWLTVNRATGNIFTVTAQENDSPYTREGFVMITMKDLSEGSYEIKIPVVQVGKGSSFVIEGYPEDTDWNESGNGSIHITVNGYVADRNWNSDANYSLSITITGYKENQNWNSDSSATGDFDLSGFSQEQNWNTAY